CKKLAANQGPGFVNKAHAIAAYQHEYIDKPEALLALCEQLHGSEWIALDTEFMREKNYFPRLCLLQVANEKSVACIDSLMLADLSPLFEVL
ncbi:MAG: hypothetical protein GWN81_07390, partial [Phycisphaerae bacterium]|nr:hypothetical protein [Phycisphaerae bacterium]